MNTAIRFPQKVGCFKVFEKAKLPHQATPGSACYDLYACVDEPLKLNPRERVLVPTGLIMDIPYGYSVRIHTRSGLSLKVGMVLANQEAVIDADYREQTYILLKNDSAERVKIFHGDRICQGELIQNLKYDIERTDTRPEIVDGRDGGMGSTGK